METVHIIHHKDGGISRMHFPDLTEEERTKRRSQFKSAVTRFCKAVEKEAGPDIWDKYEREKTKGEKV